jgi:hypothetical protein
MIFYLTFISSLIICFSQGSDLSVKEIYGRIVYLEQNGYNSTDVVLKINNFLGVQEELYYYESVGDTEKFLQFEEEYIDLKSELQEKYNNLNLYYVDETKYVVDSIIKNVVTIILISALWYMIKTNHIKMYYNYKPEMKK